MVTPGHAADRTADVQVTPGHTIGVAIEIPQPWGSQLDLERQRWQDEPLDMPAHITILPPVDMDAELLQSVISHLGRVATVTQPFRLVLRGGASFRPVSPVVFAALAEGISSCEQLEKRVRSQILSVDSRFPFHPHVTILHGGTEAELDEAFDRLAGVYGSMQITEMTLRELVDGQWLLLETFPFGG